MTGSRENPLAARTARDAIGVAGIFESRAGYGMAPSRTCRRLFGGARTWTRPAASISGRSP